MRYCGISIANDGVATCERVQPEIHVGNRTHNAADGKRNIDACSSIVGDCDRRPGIARGDGTAHETRGQTIAERTQIARAIEMRHVGRDVVATGQRWRRGEGDVAIHRSATGGNHAVVCRSSGRGDTPGRGQRPDVTDRIRAANILRTKRDRDRFARIDHTVGWQKALIHQRCARSNKNRRRCQTNIDDRRRAIGHGRATRRNRREACDELVCRDGVRPRSHRHRVGADRSRQTIEAAGCADRCEVDRSRVRAIGDRALNRCLGTGRTTWKFETTDTGRPSCGAGCCVVFLRVPKRAIVHRINVHRAVIAPASAGTGLRATRRMEHAFAFVQNAAIGRIDRASGNHDVGPLRR